MDNVFGFVYVIVLIMMFSVMMYVLVQLAKAFQGMVNTMSNSMSEQKIYNQRVIDQIVALTNKDAAAVAMSTSVAKETAKIQVENAGKSAVGKEEYDLYNDAIMQGEISEIHERSIGREAIVG